jgi:hypothetical protein
MKQIAHLVRSSQSAGAIALCVWAMSGAVSAQDEPARRPYRGLFGARQTSVDRGTTLDFTASAVGAYDNNESGSPDAGAVDPRFQVSGPRSGLSATLAYARRSERGAFNLAGGSAVSFFPELDQRPLASHNASVGFVAPLGRRTSLSASQGFAYSPTYAFGVFPPLPGEELDVVPAEALLFDYSVFDSEAFTLQSDVEVSRMVSARGSLSAFGTYRGIDQLEEQDDGVHDLTERRFGAAYSQRLSRNVGLRVGYAYRVGDYGGQSEGAEPFETHDIDLGLDYRHAISFSRRTTFSVSTGSTITRSDSVSGPSSSAAEPGASEQPGEYQYYLLATAELEHEMGLTWRARAAYERNVQYVEGFSAPFYSDAAVASLGGFLTRRADARFTALYSTGTVGLGTADGYDIASANAGLRFALSRSLALYTNYVFHQYAFSERVELPLGFARRLVRHGVRAGLSVWAPFLE